MKIFFTAIFSMLLATSFSMAQSQEKETPPTKKASRYGIGANISFDYGMMYGFDETDDDVDGNPSGVGFSAGLTFRLDLVDNFAFAPELNFAYIKTDHEYMDEERSYTRMDLELPLLLRGSVMDRFYVTFGPQLNIKLSDDTKTMRNKDLGIEEKIEQGTLDFGISAGAGVAIINNLFFDFRIYLGLKELFPDAVYIYEDGGDPKELDNWSIINMAGAKTLKFKLGFSYWFI